MPLASGEVDPDPIVAAHAAFGSAGAVIEQRRAVYQAALELLARPAAAPDLAAEVFDNPVVRAHLGEVLAGAVPLAPDCLRSLDGLTVPSASARVAGHPVRVAATAEAPAALRGAVARIGRAVERNGAAGDLRVLTSADECFAEACATVLGGVGLAWELVPKLADDLLRHVALVAILDGAAAAVVGSASAREFPGLVLVPRPRTTLEVAEAIVHEGAHQKFFDLAMIRDLLAPVDRGAPQFVSTWSSPGAPPWPPEQVVAAYHAYCCLAALSTAVDDAGLRVHGTSLLPKASRRAAEIGEWLARHGDLVGVDGADFLRALGAPLARTRAHRPVVAGPVLDGREVLVRRFGSRALVARQADPVEFFWAVVPTREDVTLC